MATSPNSIVTVLAFYHTQPYWEFHIVIIPKTHISSLTSVNNLEIPILSKVIEVVKTIATRFEEQYGACTVMTNVGEYQSNKHMHWHVYYGNRIRD